MTGRPGRVLAAGGAVAWAVLCVAAAPALAAEPAAVHVSGTAAYASSPDPHSAVVAPGPDTLAVAVGPGGETKRALLSLDLGGVASGAEVVVRISAVTGSSFGTPNGIQICRVDRSWTTGTGQPLADAPEVVCPDAPLLGEARAASYAFSLNSLLAAPADRLDVALLPAPGATVPWQVSFEAAPDEQIGIAQVAAAPRTPVTGPAPAAAPVVPPTVMPEPGWAVPAPLVPGPLPAAAELPAPEPGVPARAPVVATAVQPALPVAAYAPLPVSSWAWLLLPVGVGLLVQVARVVLDDDPDAPVPA